MVHTKRVKMKMKMKKIKVKITINDVKLFQCDK